MSTPSRFSLLASGVVIAGAVTLAVFALRAPSGPRGLAAGRCEVTWSLSLGTDAGDLPHALTAHGGAVWAATVNPAVGVGPRSAKVRLLRVTNGQRYEEALVSHAGSADAVTSWASDGRGVHLAVGAGRAVRLLSPLASGPKERVFPQGPENPPRDARTPSLALALEPDGTPAVLARWAAFSARRWHLRDTYESPAWLPPRPDVFAAPDMALVGETLLVAQSRRAGDWSRAGAGPSSVELAVLATDPFRTDTPRVLSLSRPEVPGFDPRVSVLDPNAPARGAVVAWRDAMGVVLTRVVEDRAAWEGREFMRVTDEPGDAVRAPDVAPIAGACGALVAWRRGDVVALRAVDVTAGRVGPVVTVAGASTRDGARVRVERGGARTWVAFDGVDGPRLVEVTQGADCAVTARAMGLPSAFPRGARVAGFAGDRTRAVLAVTAAAPGDAQTPLHFATLDGARGTLTAAPPAETVAQGVTELSLFEGPVAVVMGRARGSIRLQRVGERDDDGEAGEDLLLREARGEDAALIASAALHRVWVADVAGAVPAPMRPPHAVIVHSAIEALEDGPRVELPTAEPPSLDAGRITLDAITVPRDGRDVAAWASTMSASAGTSCVPGAWALLRRADNDAPLALRAPGDPWPDARALVPAEDARCGDRVLSVSWKGSRIAAIVQGERVGTRLVAGDIEGGAPRGVPLEASARVLSASVVRLGDGLLALWAVREGRGAVLRYRRFDDDGAPAAPAGSLGELLAAEDDARASRMASAATAPTEAATALATTHGPRVFHVRCGALR